MMIENILTQDMSDAEARLARIREMNNARAKKHYEANKEAIAERRKAQRAECRKAMADKAPAPAPAPEPVPEPVPAPRLRVKRPKTVAQAKREAEAKAKMMTPEQAIERINASEEFKSEESRKLYRNHLKAVVEILKCQDIISCFQDAPKVIQALDDAKQKRDQSKGYSINSKKAYVQAILRLSDILSIPLSAETKQQYVDAFDVLKLDSKKETKERQKEAQESKEEALTFAEYLPLVAEKFGKDSKEYLIASLYSVHGFRDNLQLRLVVLPDDKKDNQIYLLKKGPIYNIVLNDYKTSDKYGRKVITLSRPLSAYIQLYKMKNNIQPGDYLFGKQKLSGFISAFNKKLGLPVSINTYREMLVSPVIGGMSSKERVELAKKMGHSPATSEHYKQKKKQ